MYSKVAIYFILILLSSCSLFAGTVTLCTDIGLPCEAPDPDQEITFYIHCNSPIFFVNLKICINGDATVTSFIQESEKTTYGWEELTTAIDEENTIHFTGISWANNPCQTIGYFKLKVNSSRVAVYFQDDSLTFSFAEDFNYQTEPITLGRLTLPPLKEPDIPQPAIINNPDIPDNPVRDTLGTLAVSPPPPVSALPPESDVIEVSGTINTNTVWTKNKIYYVIDEAVYVHALLVIEPGTVVIFGYDCGMVIEDNGTVIAKGTPDQPIIFTVDAMYYLYPEWIGYYWQSIPSMGSYYWTPLAILSTANPATTIKYCMIEGATGGIMLDNITLDEPIENNYLFGNYYGILEIGPKLTDIKNNLCFFNSESGIEVYFENEAGQVDPSAVLRIEQNTCDNFQYNGINVHGASEPNNAPMVYLNNNIVSNSYWYGLNMDGYMQILASRTGYYNNAGNKYPDFNEHNPVICLTDPYIAEIGEKPYHHHYLKPGCSFIDVGEKYIEFTPYIGMTTDCNSLPDENQIDLGFHHWNWSYQGASEHKNSDDLLSILTHWLRFDPADPNGPGYIDPNLVSDPNILNYEGDLNNDGYVDLLDFSLLSASWRNTPDITAVIEREPNKTHIIVHPPDTVEKNIDSIFAFLDGKFVGSLYGMGTKTPILLDISVAGNQSQELKLVTFGEDQHFYYSEPTEIVYDSPLKYCVLPTYREAGKPLPFSAINTGQDTAIVEVYNLEGNVTWSREFNERDINGTIPADVLADPYFYRIDFRFGKDITFKPNVERLSIKDMNPDARALLVLPDINLNYHDPRGLLAVVRACVARFNNDWARLEGSNGTWENVAAYGQYNTKLRYIYVSTHGDYNLYDNESDEVLRTFTKLAGNEWVPSCKYSEFVNPPSWCKPFRERGENNARTWASMRIADLRFVQMDSCYSGRLKIDQTGNLIEGEPGQRWLFDSQSDITLALGLDDTYWSKAYHGWWDPATLRYMFQTTYQQWTQTLWNEMAKGFNLEDAILEAINKATEFDPDAAINNYRLRGQGDIKKIRLINYDPYE